MMASPVNIISNPIASDMNTLSFGDHLTDISNDERASVGGMPRPISISGNIGSLPDVIFHLTSGPSSDRSANNNGRANAACGSPHGTRGSAHRGTAATAHGTSDDGTGNRAAPRRTLRKRVRQRYCCHKRE
jgi:hypothetical protein